MISERHPLRQLFHEVVAGCYHRHSGIDDPEMTSYVGDLLTEFTAAENLYLRDAEGHTLKDLHAMVAASDPVFGDAPSFDVERKVRRHIGDFALFATGMYPESMGLWKHSGDASFAEMVNTGKEELFHRRRVRPVRVPRRGASVCALVRGVRALHEWPEVRA